MAASDPGTSSETDARYWVWFAGGGPTAKTVAEATSVEPIVPPMVEPWPAWGTATTWTVSPATRGTEGIWSPFSSMPTTCSPGGQLRGGRQHLSDHDLAGVDGGVELLADHGGRAGGRHGRDVARGRDGGGGQIARR